MLPLQEFNATDILPDMQTMGWVGVILSQLLGSRTWAWLQPYGVYGDLFRIGAAGVVLAGLM